MMKLSYEQIVEKIKEKKGISEEEIDKRVQEKLEQLAGLISKDGAAHIIANELGINVFEETLGPTKLNKLIPGMRSVETVGKVRAKYDIREFSTARGAGKVGSLLIADETGLCRVTFWNDQTDKLADVKEEDIIRIKNGYVKENNGRSEVHLNDNSTIELNPEGVTVEAVERGAAAPMDFKRKKISELEENDQSVELLGTIVQVFEPRFFEVCPQCGKRARQREDQFVCQTHDVVTPDHSYVMNAVIDDGSETIRGVFFRDQAEQLMGKTKEEVKQYREFKEKFDEVKIELLGQMIKLQGKVSRNQMFDRLEIVARNVVMNPKPEEELDRLNKELKNEQTV
jgi:hypothetical protein